MKRPDGITLISIYHFVEAGLCLLGACVAIIVPILVGAVLTAEPQPDAGVAIVTTTIVVIVVVAGLFLYGLANVVVGWGLWRLLRWARMGAIVLSCLRLLNIPIGTAIGGVTLWYLFQPEARAAFGEVQQGS